MLPKLGLDPGALNPVFLFLVTKFNLVTENPPADRQFCPYLAASVVPVLDLKGKLGNQLPLNVRNY